MTVVLDGGLSTELQRRGISVSAPWWTSHALRSGAGRAALCDIHAAYARAGATVVTANTFRANLRAMTRAGLDPGEAADLVEAAVAAARAGAGPGVTIAASVAPVEDCYAPSLVPPDDQLRAEHDWMAGVLARTGGVDIVLVETMNTVREAVAAVSAATTAGMTAWASFVCGDEARLLSGEPLADAVRAAERAGAAAVLVNCTSVPRVRLALPVLAATATVPFGAYPNIEDRDALPYGVHQDRHVPTGWSAEAYAELVREWRNQFGDLILGGCCGSTPQHIAAMAAARL